MVLEPTMSLLPNSPLRRAFPPEIFLVIKSCIPLGDIRTHVCFYDAHPRIAAMYDSEKDAENFWRRVCWHSGVGAVGKDDLKSPHCWRDIALEVIRKDGFCKHPQCGAALLVYNRRRMQSLDGFLKPLTVFTDWKDDLYDGSDSDSDGDSNSGMDIDAEGGQGTESDDSEDDGPPHLIVHRVLNHIGFRPRTSQLYYGVREDARLEPRTEEERAYSGNTFLREHPLVVRSFATDVPVNRFRLGQLAGREFSAPLIKRRTGVTVLDIITTIYRDLDARLDDHERDELVNALIPFVVGGLSEDDVLDRFHTLRDVLAECHIYEWYYDGTIIDAAPLICPSIQEN